jgi:hypothetical protein
MIIKIDISALVARGAMRFRLLRPTGYYGVSEV